IEHRRGLRHVELGAEVVFVALEPVRRSSLVLRERRDEERDLRVRRDLVDRQGALELDLELTSAREAVRSKTMNRTRDDPRELRRDAPPERHGPAVRV